MRTTGWIVWDKYNKEIVVVHGMFAYTNRTKAWLVAMKERKDSPYEVIRIKIKKYKTKEQ